MKEFTSHKVYPSEHKDFKIWCSFHGYTVLKATSIALKEFMIKHNLEECPTLKVKDPSL